MRGGECAGWGACRGGMHGGGRAWQGACVAEGACMARGVRGKGAVHGRRDGHCSGQYASYWNAFLFNEYDHFRTDLFDSKSQSDLLTLIAMKFDE